MNIEKINFGPTLGKCKVDDVLVNELLETGLQQTTKNNKYLAGKIEHEFTYDEKLKNYFEPLIIPYLKNYLIQLEYSVNGYNDIEFKLSLDSLWINRQKNFEYNPPHSHNKHLSFVIYLQIPEEIKKEKNITSSNQPGSIEFNYGDNNNFSGIYGDYKDNIVSILSPITAYTYFPNVGDMFIFPSYLRHHVDAFKTSNVERISVSGNLIVVDKKMKGII